MTLTLRTLVDGPENVVIHGYLVGTGTLSNETNTVVVDYSALSGSFSSLNLCSIDHSFSGFEAILEWDADTDTTVWHLPDSTDGHQEFEVFYGISNDSQTGRTEDLTITTTGVDDGDRGTFILTLKKD
jgi:hypothetical protein